MQIQPLRLELSSRTRPLIEQFVEVLVEAYCRHLTELAAAFELQCRAAIGKTDLTHKLGGWSLAGTLTAICVKRPCWEQEFSAAFDRALTQRPPQQQPVAHQDELFPSPFEETLAAWAVEADLCSPSAPGAPLVSRGCRTYLHVWIDSHARAGKSRDRNGSGSPAVPAHSRSAGPPVCRGVALGA